MHLTNSSPEWLANEPNEKPSKRLNLRSISLRDVSLAIKDEMLLWTGSHGYLTVEEMSNCIGKKEGFLQNNSY